MAMTNHPTLWDSLLDKAPAGSILMGGAVRDMYVGKEAKDYDIFYPYMISVVPEIPGWKYLPRDPHDQAKIDEDYDIEPADGTPNPIAAVYDYDVAIANLDIIRVQLIGLHYIKPKEHFKNFDHTLTLAAYTDKGLFIDKRLMQSIENNTVTLINNMNPEKSLQRAKKVIERIDPHGAPNWTYQGF